MKKIACYLIVLIVALSPVIPCHAEDGVPFQIRRLSERLLVITGGRNNGNTIVVASKRGLIIIDTNWSQYFAKKIKEIVKKEMGREDYAYVINTHGHGDHTGGNQMFPGAEIIAHVNAYRAMKQDRLHQQKRLKERLGYVRSRLKSYKKQLEAPGAHSAVTHKAAIERHLLADYTGGFVFTPPSMHFIDRLTLYMGDITVKLFYYGESHSSGDILVQVPEEGVLMTGDIGFDTYLGFFGDTQKPLNAPRWFEVLDDVLESEIKYVVTGHDLIWTKNDFLARVQYIRELWAGVANAKKQGHSLDDALKQFDLDKKFPYVNQWKPRPWESQRDRETLLKRHGNIIKMFWNQLHSNH